MNKYLIANPLIRHYIFQYISAYASYIDDKAPLVLCTTGQKRINKHETCTMYALEFTIQKTGLRSGLYFLPKDKDADRYLYGLCTGVYYGRN